MKKFAADRPFADPDAAARKLVEIANGIRTRCPRQWRRIRIDRYGYRPPWEFSS